jgi:hypothetical protein
LIELMIALVVSSLLVGMILAIFLRMSLAYRGQQQVSGIQQVLASARQLIETDAKHAGLQLGNGIKLASSDTIRFAPVAITNSSTGPDQIRFMYADTTIQGAVISNGDAATGVPLDDNDQFKLNDLVMIVNTDITQANPDDPAGANVTQYDSCIGLIDQVPLPGIPVHISNTAPYGSGSNSHCPALIAGKTMMFKIVARAYRIDPDPARAVDGVLQMSATGDLFGANDWQDIGFGFTDLQVATQFYDGDGIDTLDPDTDPKRDWHSSESQELMSASGVTLPAVPLQMTITLVARTDKDVEGVATAATPNLTDLGNPTNNMIGDRAPVDLTTTLDPALTGSRIYRYMTFTVDLRNAGVGR